MPTFTVKPTGANRPVKRLGGDGMLDRWATPGPVSAIMTRTIRLSLCTAAVLALALPARGAEAPAKAPSATTNRVNILFLMDDQHRGDWLGAAGAKWLITPNLDRLAREGVLFRRSPDNLSSII